VDNLRAGRVRFSPDELHRFCLETVDITDPERVGELVSRFDPDVIINLAALHYIPECEALPGLTVATNVAGTVNLMAVCPPRARFVLISSGAVYEPDVEAHDEQTSPTGPSDVYGWSKLQAEQFVGHFARHANLAAVVVRLFNVVGPGETNRHLLPEVIAQLKAGNQRLQLGNLTPRRDYVHVDDAAAAIVAASVGGHVEAGEVVTVNASSGRHYSVQDVVARVRQVSGIDVIVVEDRARLRAVDRPILVGDNARIKKIFDWEPRFDLDQAIADCWEDPELPEELIAGYRAQ
jgi:UDP-glucose 4-epimerase